MRVASARLRARRAPGGFDASAATRIAQGMDVTPAPVKPLIKPEALDALDIRVGTIVSVENVPEATRLVRLTVDFGDHRRSIVAGMRTERADPREIEGRQALFVVNLEPKKIRGQISEGMLFDIGSADGLTPVLAVPERAVPDGTRAG